MADFILAFMVLLPLWYFYAKLRTVVEKRLKTLLLLLSFGLYFYFGARFLMHWFGLWDQSVLLNGIGLVLSVATVLLAFMETEKYPRNAATISIGVLAAIEFVMSFYKASSVAGVVYSLKDNALPFLWFFVGLRISRHRVPWLHRFFSLYLLTGGLYTLAFHLGAEASFDRVWFNQIALQNGHNWWQGDVVRFWGLFTNFQEWYGVSALIVVWLYGQAKADPTSPRKLDFIVGLVGFALMCLRGPERAAIAVALAGIVTIMLFSQPRGVRAQLLKVSTVSFSMMLIVSLLIMARAANISADVDSAYGRLIELANPLSAGTVQIRQNDQWATALALIRLNPSGVGPEKLSSTAVQTSLVATHSFYLHAILAYSIWVAVAMFALLIVLLGYLLYRIYMTRTQTRTTFATVVGLLLPHLLLAAFDPVLSNNSGKFLWVFIGLTLSNVSVASWSDSQAQLMDNPRGVSAWA